MSAGDTGSGLVDMPRTLEGSPPSFVPDQHQGHLMLRLREFEDAINTTLGAASVRVSVLENRVKLLEAKHAALVVAVEARKK